MIWHWPQSEWKSAGGLGIPAPPRRVAESQGQQAADPSLRSVSARTVRMASIIKMGLGGVHLQHHGSVARQELG